MSGYKLTKQTPAMLDTADEASERQLEMEHQAIQKAKLAARLDTFRPHEGLQNLRKELGVSQEVLARSAGVTRRSYQFYESGQKQIPSGVLARLAATYQFDLHRLFTGTAHSDNLQIRTKTAKLAAEVIEHLSERFSEPSMEMNEMQRIAMEYVRSHPLGTEVSRGDIFDTIRIVTGDKYLREEVPYSAVDEG
ncbi:helix-turn-helix domain-containing protein [Aliiroseovarius sp. CAU 1755]